MKFEKKFVDRNGCRLALKTEVKANGEFEGYASVFNGNDSYNDTILPGAYSEALKKLDEEEEMPSMYFEHRSAWFSYSQFPLRIGKWTKMEEDDVGLQVRGQLSLGHPVADAVYASMKTGTLDGMSVGIFLSEDDYREKEGGGRIISKVAHLEEVSLVEMPADSSAKIDLAALKNAGELETVRDVERFLRDAGNLSRDAARALVSQFKSAVEREAAARASKGDTDLSMLLERFKNAKIARTFWVK